MAKFLLVVKSQDQLNINTAVNVALGLKMMGAEDVKIVFLGPGITALDKNNSSVAEIVQKNSQNLKQSNIRVYACQMAMANYNVKQENLVYYDGNF